MHNLKHLVFQVTPACSPLPFTRESLPPLPLPRPPLAPRPPLNPPIPSGFGVAFLTSTWWQVKEELKTRLPIMPPFPKEIWHFKTITHRATRWKHNKVWLHMHCNVSSLLTWTGIFLKLWRITKQKPIEIQIKRRKWNWIGHTLRKEAGAIDKTALDWNPLGYRRRGRPKRTWRRTIQGKISIGRSWNEVKGIDGDRNAWKLFMDALCSTRSKRIRWW